MPSKSASVKTEKQVRSAQGQGNFQASAAKIANTPDASKKGGKASGSGIENNDSSRGEITDQKKAGSNGGEGPAAKKKAKPSMPLAALPAPSARFTL